MQSSYKAEEAAEYVARYGREHGHDLAVRVYTSRLLGRDRALVLHGGGNTSVKSTVTELVGDVTEVLFIKGSGWDLAAIEPRGFPACRMAHLRRLCELERMSDEEMVAQLRGAMIDPSSPTPSVEALLHAALPAKFVDHTHADAVLALVDQPRSREIANEVWGERALFIPYVMPGFVLARRVAELWAERRRTHGEPSVMILDKHGIFTWGSTAEESYQRMIDSVTCAERYADGKRPKASTPVSAGPRRSELAAVTPIVRGAFARVAKRPWIATWRATPGLLSFSARGDLASISQRGCATPDHVIRTKGRPLVLDPAGWQDPEVFGARVERALLDYAAAYDERFRRSAEARRVSPQKLDPWPRVVLVPGFGVLTVAKTLAEAEIAADIYEHTASIIETATALSEYRPVDDLDLFDVEYWSLEQAKLKKGGAAEGPLAGRIAFVTGAAAGIGLATSRALLDAGAHVMMADRDAEPLERTSTELAKKHGKRVERASCDVTRESDVTEAIARTVLRFGGLDVVVSNAGAAFSGKLHTADGDAALRASLELNFLSHQLVARAASAVLLAQKSGGALLFNASKSAFNQGPDFGPYAVPKAALIALMRQYAVDLASARVRVNAVNADRVRTDIFGKGLLESRAKARGLTVDEYFTSNLLGRETTADDVARAFVYLATAEATTGCVVTVDGGNAAAFPR